MIARKWNHQSGFTLIEVVLVIVIAGILVSIAIRSAVTVSETSKVEQTKQELNALAFAIAGNPELQNNGVRSDFGYVGDVGALPPNLDALRSNPGAYATWNGPYIGNRFSQIIDDYKKDAWGALYQYSGGVTITSTSGSGIVRKLANSVADLLQNQVTGAVFDLDGTPPGPTYKDSVSVRLTIPDGSGSMLTRTSSPDAGGYFSFDSIPIGNHDIEIIYLPDDDSLKRFVSVLPRSSIYGDYYLDSNYWYDGMTSALQHYAGAVGTNSWQNPANAVGSGEGSCSYSGYGINIVTGFWNSYNFAIPSGATIQGIIVEFKVVWRDDPENGLGVNVGKSEATLGTEKTTLVSGSGNADCGDGQIISLGSSTDLWGLTWTPADINSANFTVRLRRSVLGDETEVILNWIRVSVYYT